MLAVETTTLENFHVVKIVPNVEEITNLLDAIFHDRDSIATGVGHRIASHWIHLKLQHTATIALLMTTHLDNHEHIVQVESAHVLVESLGLLVPVTNKRETQSNDAQKLAVKVIS